MKQNAIQLLLLLAVVQFLPAQHPDAPEALTGDYAENDALHPCITPAQYALLIEGTRTELDLQAPAGVYAYRLSREGQSVASGRILVR